MCSNLLTTFLLSLLQLQFAIASQGYDPEFARFAFEHAAAAYSRDPLKCLAKYHGTYILRRGNVSCDHFHDECLYYISLSPMYIVIAFGGTHSRLQLIAEILAGMAEPKAEFIAGGSVQRYFSAAFKSVWKDMWHLLRRTLETNNTRPIIFTGHSLGGSLASLASSHFAYFYASRGIDSADIRLITFGEPRTGNRDYAYAHDILVPVSFRVVHRGDLVPHLPSCLINVRTFACSSRFNFGPYHHGIEIWYPENMTETSPFRLCLGQPQNEDQTCSDGYYRHYTIEDHLYYFGEHVSNYGVSGCKASESITRKNFT
ncbi:triacylglycerol lipase [Onchocerca flexuosa]|uniref:Triacylglycerol lipase n=2 Tax=Onchocerca flexuosa TaxID=387005 RepID=A0A238C6A3_9BILA|nr:triacylglycerol lipase [Onchocerca flexuosa]